MFAALARAIHGLDPAAQVAAPTGYQADVNAQLAQNTWTIHVSVIVLLVYARTPDPSHRSRRTQE